MGRFNLVVQHPQPQKPVNGVLRIDEHGGAQFLAGDGDESSKIIGSIECASVGNISADGILISGVERIGENKFMPQEWMLVYVPDLSGQLISAKFNSILVSRDYL